VALVNNNGAEVVRRPFCYSIQVQASDTRDHNAMREIRVRFGSLESDIFPSNSPQLIDGLIEEFFPVRDK
jgi:hypothetical protein